MKQSIVVYIVVRGATAANAWFLLVAILVTDFGICADAVSIFIVVWIVWTNITQVTF